jgi:hypothetical protein
MKILRPARCAAPDALLVMRDLSHVPVVVWVTTSSSVAPNVSRPAVRDISMTPATTYALSARTAAQVAAFQQITARAVLPRGHLRNHFICSTMTVWMLAPKTSVSSKTRSATSAPPSVRPVQMSQTYVLLASHTIGLIGKTGTASLPAKRTSRSSTSQVNRVLPARITVSHA